MIFGPHYEAQWSQQEFLSSNHSQADYRARYHSLKGLYLNSVHTISMCVNRMNHTDDCTGTNLVWSLTRKQTWLLEEMSVSAGAFYWDYQRTDRR